MSSFGGRGGSRLDSIMRIQKMGAMMSSSGSLTAKAPTFAEASRFKEAAQRSIYLDAEGDCPACNGQHRAHTCGVQLQPNWRGKPPPKSRKPKKKKAMAKKGGGGSAISAAMAVAAAAGVTVTFTHAEDAAAADASSSSEDDDDDDDDGEEDEDLENEDDFKAEQAAERERQRQRRAAVAERKRERERKIAEKKQAALEQLRMMPPPVKNTHKDPSRGRCV